MRLINAEQIEWYGCMSEMDCPYKDRECKDCDRAECYKSQVDALPEIDPPKATWDLNEGVLTYPLSDNDILEITYSSCFWDIRHDILLKLMELREDHVESLTIREIEKLIMSIPCKGGGE